MPNPDTIITNHEGETVWLKKVTEAECAASFKAAGVDPGKAHGYTTDCCVYGEECHHHAEIRSACDGVADGR